MEKPKSYVITISLRVKWHEILGKSNEDITVHQFDIIELKSEGLTLTWDRKEKNFSSIFEEKDKISVVANSETIEVTNEDLASLTEDPEMLSFPIHKIIEYQIMHVQENTSYDNEINLDDLNSYIESLNNQTLKEAE